jgi:hypothetical protein
VWPRGGVPELRTPEFEYLLDRRTLYGNLLGRNSITSLDVAHWNGVKNALYLQLRLKEITMTVVQAKTDAGEQANLTLEFDSPEVVVSIKREDGIPGEVHVRLGEAQLDDVIATLREFRRQLRQGRKAQKRAKDVAASPA